MAKAEVINILSMLIDLRDSRKEFKVKDQECYVGRNSFLFISMNSSEQITIAP